MRTIASALASGWYRVMRRGTPYQVVPRRTRRDQRVIWGDPSMVLTPVASTEFFMASSIRSLTNVERTVLGSTSRRNRAAVLA